MTILVTGAAGFIGFFLSQRLLEQGYDVVGVDNLNAYYDVNLKKNRLAILRNYSNFMFYKTDICDQADVHAIFGRYKFEKVVHLAAQAGVRYSIENPQAYIESNIVGFFNIMDAAREYGVADFLYASSSSVYGNAEESSLSTDLNVDHPVSLYAATKKSNELIAHTYSHLYGLNTTGLRFFTVYGPLGRPDMAYFKFAKSIMEGRTIQVYNNGDLWRDFTYIDDIVEGIDRLLHRKVAVGCGEYDVFNIGNHSPVKLLDFIEVLEQHLGRKANKQMVGMQPGDVYSTCADVEALQKAVGFEPSTALSDGLAKFAIWFKGDWYPKQLAVQNEVDQPLFV